MRFEKNYLESEERYLGDGFFPTEREFFELLTLDSLEDSSEHRDIFYGGVIIEISPNAHYHNRSIYSILDFLGDVGGLDSILLSIGHFILLCFNLLFGSALEEKMRNSIFVSKDELHENNAEIVP